MYEDNIVLVEQMLGVGYTERPLFAPDAYLVNQPHA
jgi:hypothetical protein